MRATFPWYRIIWNLITAPFVMISLGLLYVTLTLHYASFKEAHFRIKGMT